MIRSFRHKGLKELFDTGKSARIGKSFHARIIRRLDALNVATQAEAMSIPGYDFHTLKGTNRYTFHVNGPWCITFEFKNGHAEQVDFEQYH